MRTLTIILVGVVVSIIATPLGGIIVTVVLSLTWKKKPKPSK